MFRIKKSKFKELAKAVENTEISKKIGADDLLYLYLLYVNEKPSSTFVEVFFDIPKTSFYDIIKFCISFFFIFAKKQPESPQKMPSQKDRISGGIKVETVKERESVLIAGIIDGMEQKCYKKLDKEGSNNEMVC